ncbi:UNVERIFIED_CONTAM: Transcriptional activator DEMETER [Sesamum radiatum]|uniref:Transcriptional activator DEMETER n=1 Tax=Sesamum radiatum TaxID=300843 RepID=A0AAW2JXD7_SESRA
MGSLFPDKRPLIGHQQLENPAYRQNPGPASSSNGHSYPSISKVPHHQSSVPSSSTNSCLSLEKWEADVLAFSGKESISSLVSTDFDISNRVGVECRNNIGRSPRITFTAIQDGRAKLQPSAMNHAIPNKNLELQTDFDVSQNGNGQHSINHKQGKQENFHEDSVLRMEPTGPAEASTQPSGNVLNYFPIIVSMGRYFDVQVNLIADNWKHDDIRLEPTEVGQVDSSSRPSVKISPTTPNARKRKAEKEKAEPFNWDTLRKQDFLNRIVRDHERIDLEWLRDVPPDKSKDYLLSIRGLGLKSVECVRLLTLHHLAFPVDTNVGRIAVRLGWVPLQPSLSHSSCISLNLLESIQKYLWPRLCKLDQETLYELHYQMITFGKVFCTKREPNCNACPMRGECRHFASAFASARLALPGPEGRQMTSSASQYSARKSSEVIIKPIALPASEDNIERGTGLTRNSEPFIEEPTTPEPPTEVSEKDIEDAFYEDPDEIPVIKLNVEEFTTNLQSFMQEQMEVGEGDMSKALVALSPELASIPMLTQSTATEHQV